MNETMWYNMRFNRILEHQGMSHESQDASHETRVMRPELLSSLES